MTVNLPALAENRSPAVRMSLLSVRLQAMRGDIEAALARLDEMSEALATSGPLDRFGLGLLKAELLHLDRREADAIHLLRRLDDEAKSFPDEYRFAVGDNLAQAQMSALSADGPNTYYHLVDRWRLAGVDWYGKDELIDVYSALEREQYNDAVAAVWRSLTRAHGIGSWQLVRFARERFAKLCVRLGALEEACHYAVFAETDVKELNPLVAALEDRRDRDLVHSIIGQFLRYANLRRHFFVASSILARIADLIPDSDVLAIGRWVLPRCGEPPEKYGSGSAMTAAWKLAHEIGTRLPTDLATQFVEVGLRHPCWLAPLLEENLVLIDRETIADALARLVYRVPISLLPGIADQTLPLAIERFQDHDYPKVINLLCHIANRGGSELKQRISSALYVPGKPVNRILAQLVGFFDVDALTSEQWKRYADKVCEETKHIVQRVNTGEQQIKLPEEMMVLTMPTSYGHLAVTTTSGVGLASLAEQHEKLDDELVKMLIRTIVGSVTDRDNTLSNREVLLNRLSNFAKRADPDLRREVVEAIRPMASGDVQESNEYPTAVELNSPLRRGRIDQGTIAAVRTMALVTIAHYAAGVEALEEEVYEVISDALVDSEAGVRQGAYSAARRLPCLPNDGIQAVLMGLRDPDHKACISAFAAMAERTEWVLTRPMWKLFLLAAKMASQSVSVVLRRHVVHALKARISSVPTGMLKRRAEELLQALANDIAFSVREVVHEEEQVESA